MANEEEKKRLLSIIESFEGDEDKNVAEKAKEAIKELTKNKE